MWWVCKALDKSSTMTSSACYNVAMNRLKPFALFIVFLVLFWRFTSVAAQEAVNLRLSDPIIDAFPQVKVILQARDASGRLMNNLPISAFSVLEDNQPAADLAIEQIELGTRLIYALNTSPALRLRDTLGRSRFELVRAALLEWYALPEHALLGVDEYHLVTAEGIQLENARSSADIASILASLEPTFEIEGNYELLFRALDITNQPTPSAGMSSNILFITPLLRPSLEIPLENIIARANATQTAIYPILIGPPDILDQPEFESFEQLANETGGSVTYFDPEEGLLTLAQEIVSQRRHYQLTYRSLATTSGSHDIRVRVSSNQLEAESQPRSFVLELLDPKLTLLNLPAEILRKSDDPSIPMEDIPPTSLDIEFAVQFPDGYPRAIIQSQLLVDGEIFDQKLEPPFSPLVWDLEDELSDRSAAIQVVVMDSLGLKSTSLSSEINLRVELPPRGLAAVRPALSSFLIALGVLLGGVALAVLLLSLGRQPATISPSARVQPARQITPVSRLRQELPDEPIEAYLHPLEGDQDSPGTIYLTGIEISIGRDPTFAAVPIDDLSVEGLHARIIRQVDGSYILRDQGSAAGTWIQYQPIADAGQKLSHGDIVHFGRSGYRFALVDPPPEKEIRITPTRKSNGLAEETET